MNIFFIPTSNSSVMYWRIQSHVEQAWKSGLASFKNELWYKELNEIQPWQGWITDGPDYDAIKIRQLVPMIENGCQQADAVVFQYAHQEGALELFDSIKIKFPNLPIVVEIDDNVLSVPVYNEAHDPFAPGSSVRGRVINQLRSADAVIVSTPYLKEIYSEYNANIYVVPNSINFKQWDKLKGKSKPGVRIGWAGGSGHEGDFEPVAEALKKVLAKHKDARLVFVNGPAKNGIPECLKGVDRVEHHANWTPILKYPKMLADMDFDIGIAPVLDSAFNRGKSNLKWLENSALGIPTVASNVGHLAETIRTGVDGFLCDDENDFFLALDVLVSDRKRRKAVGLAANARVRKDFNIETVNQDYISILGEIARKKASNDLVRVGEIVEAVQ